MFFLFFGTKYLSFLGAVEIGRKEAGICLGIMLATMTLDGLFNYIVEKMAFHEKLFESKEEVEQRTERISKGSID